MISLTSSTMMPRDRGVQIGTRVLEARTRAEELDAALGELVAACRDVGHHLSPFLPAAARRIAHPMIGTTAHMLWSGSAPNPTTVAHLCPIL